MEDSLNSVLQYQIYAHRVSIIPIAMKFLLRIFEDTAFHEIFAYLIIL